MQSLLSLKIKKLKFNTDTLLSLLFVYYFCNNLVASVVIRIFEPGVTYYFYNFSFWLIVLTYCLLEKRKYLVPSFFLYLIISVLLALTLLIHPEYDSWLLDGPYSIKYQFLYARAGIWAFLVVSMIAGKKQFSSVLRVAAWVAFLYYGMQFVIAMNRGYWISHTVSGMEEMGRYNLAFGYHMLFPVIYFGLVAYLDEKRLYFIPFILSLLMILMGGSRGSLVCVPLLFFFALPFKWNNMNKQEKNRSILIIFVLLFLMIFFCFYYDAFFAGVQSLVRSTGISSRSIDGFLNNTFLNENGRDRIRAIVLELIGTGGPFGRGIYGERLAVGEFFRWGYSHNIILEMLCSFGYVGGTIILLAIFVGIIKTYRCCENTRDQIIFLTFLVTSCKLMFSDSFWYCDTFWAMLAVMLVWKRKKKC